MTASISYHANWIEMCFEYINRAVLTTFASECALKETNRSPLVIRRPKPNEIANMQFERHTNEKQQRYPKLLEIHEKEIEMQRLIEKPIIECRYCCKHNKQISNLNDK